MIARNKQAIADAAQEVLHSMDRLVLASGNPALARHPLFDTFRRAVEGQRTNALRPAAPSRRTRLTVMVGGRKDGDAA